MRRKVFTDPETSGDSLSTNQAFGPTGKVSCASEFQTSAIHVQTKILDNQNTGYKGILAICKLGDVTFLLFWYV